MYESGRPLLNKIHSLVARTTYQSDPGSIPAWAICSSSCFPFPVSPATNWPLSPVTRDPDQGKVNKKIYCIYIFFFKEWIITKESIFNDVNVLRPTFANKLNLKFNQKQGPWLRCCQKSYFTWPRRTVHSWHLSDGHKHLFIYIFSTDNYSICKRTGERCLCDAPPQAHYGSSRSNRS